MDNRPQESRGQYITRVAVSTGVAIGTVAVGALTGGPAGAAAGVTAAPTSGKATSDSLLGGKKSYKTGKGVGDT